LEQQSRALSLQVLRCLRGLGTPEHRINTFEAPEHRINPFASAGTGGRGEFSIGAGCPTQASMFAACPPLLFTGQDVQP